MPLQATSGAASYDAFGGGAAAVPNYIEDVFSTYLYTGTGSAQTITNGIDLAGKGGLVWTKRRDASGDNILTVAGNGLNLSSNLMTDFINDGQPIFSSNGFNLPLNSSYTNVSGGTYASWTWRKQTKFFDVVTYTGSGANRTIAHNLGSEPACIIIKSTNRNSTDWAVYHRSLGNTQYIRLNNTGAAATSSTYWNNTTPTSTVFSLGTNADVNNSGGANYVAYLFAHNAGGFGLTGTDNVISCGSYVGNNGTNPVNLGYEAQFVLIKNTTNTTGSSNWVMYDNMRGLSMTSASVLRPNLSNSETTDTTIIPSATGFTLNGGGGSTNFSGDTYIYIAIRRGPMRTPTSGTSVFTPIARTGTGAPATVTGVGFPTDLVFHRARLDNVISPANLWQDRLRGIQQFVNSSNTNIEYSDPDAILTLTMDGMTVGSDTNEGNVNYSGVGYINYFMRRAPSFFDEVCYLGNGSTQTINHNLGSEPGCIIIKVRNEAGSNWWVWHRGDGATFRVLNLDRTSVSYTSSYANGDSVLSAAPTSTTFSVKNTAADLYGTNQTGGTYVAYLFATCAGVSKVGSYTGTATTLQIDCGFTGGARFVLIKRTDSTGDWYVWDTARGIVSGNDSYLLLNSTAAEVTNTDYIDTYSAGFELSSTAPAALNASGGTYIFLAIA